MKKNYCVGVCPLCNNQGLLIPIRKGKKISFICDESFHLFEKFEDISKRKFVFDEDLSDDYLELDEFLKEMPEMKEHVFIFENGDWHNIKNKKLYNKK